MLPTSFDQWQSSPEYEQYGCNLSLFKFREVTDLLLENPNLNSTHLFRADILSDTARVLKTNSEKQEHLNITITDPLPQSKIHDDFTIIPPIDDATLKRSVLRRLIPRNQQLDKPLVQTCHVYSLADGGEAVVYVPHADEENMPWYHPPVKALAYIFTCSPNTESRSAGSATLTIRFVPFKTSQEPIPQRLHRTFISLLNTFIRLAKNPAPNTVGSSASANPSSASRSTHPSAIKDTIIPQHLVQDTYADLKQKYASDLIARWVEKTEPSKHVFEDIMIAAFLIKLWKQMYHHTPFPGFVDIACGNGVLVYIFIKEGYNGFGLDARRRKTWEVLGIDEYLQERIMVPKPFLDSLPLATENVLSDTDIHDGMFPPNTFIISNHADELTPWTPILAALSSPGSPLPFLAIPCCSHALSGARYRYSPKDALPAAKSIGEEEQSASGDLRALRAQKAKAATHDDDKSMYACLTKKVIAIAEEVGFEDVEMTLMRIPSTRNIGVFGGRKMASVNTPGIEVQVQTLSITDAANIMGDAGAAMAKVQALLERECAISGGIEASARVWIERAKKLQTGKGRGKVNLGHKPEPDEVED